MTFLNTMNNLGTMWPRSAALALMEATTVKTVKVMLTLVLRRWVAGSRPLIAWLLSFLPRLLLCLALVTMVYWASTLQLLPSLGGPRLVEATTVKTCSYQFSRDGDLPGGGRPVPGTEPA